MLAVFFLSRAFGGNKFERFCRLVEGEWTDPEMADPLSDMFALLNARRDRALTQQWGVWLAGKDTERALKVGPNLPHPLSHPDRHLNDFFFPFVATDDTWWLCEARPESGGRGCDATSDPRGEPRSRGPVSRTSRFAKTENGMGPVWAATTR